MKVQVKYKKQGAYPMDGGESSFVYFLNQDYAEEDEEDEFKVFFSSYSSFSVLCCEFN